MPPLGSTVYFPEAINLLPDFLREFPNCYSTSKTKHSPPPPHIPPRVINYVNGCI